MNIIKEDQNIMVIRDRNIIAFLVGIVFALFGILVILKPDFFTNTPPVWSGFVGIAAGVFIILVVKMITITLDRVSRKAVFEEKTLINKKSQECELGLIKQVELQQVYASGSGGFSYRLALISNAGEEIPLNLYGSSAIKIMGKQIIPERETGARIAKFLNVPFLERRPPTVSETLAAIQSAAENARKENRK